MILIIVAGKTIELLLAIEFNMIVEVFKVVIIKLLISITQQVSTFFQDFLELVS